MSDLPTREEAEHAEEFDSALWVDEWEMAADLVKARAEGTLMTRQEFIDRLDSMSMFMCWSIPAKRWMKRAHSALYDCNSRCGDVLIVKTTLGERP